MIKNPLKFIAVISSVAGLLALFLWLAFRPAHDPSIVANPVPAKQDPVQAYPVQARQNANAKPATDSAPVSQVHPPIVMGATLEGTSGECEIDGKRQPLTGSDGLFDRVMVPEKTPLKLRLFLPNLSPGKDILITAPNGGRLRRADDGALRFAAQSSSQNLDLVFEPFGSPGAYTVIVQHRGISQTFDFWVGPPHPRGLPGPAYSTKPTTSKS